MFAVFRLPGSAITSPLASSYWQTSYMPSDRAIRWVLVRGKPLMPVV